jgi:hypothetical protein
MYSSYKSEEFYIFVCMFVEVDLYEVLFNGPKIYVSISKKVVMRDEDER